MIIHKVRQPFMCREGQFTPGQRELCIGLDYHAIQSTDQFHCYLGKNEKTTYIINSTEALTVGQPWKNPKGKIVLIIPLRIAKVKKEPEEPVSAMAALAGMPEELRIKTRKKLGLPV